VRRAEPDHDAPTRQAATEPTAVMAVLSAGTPLPAEVEHAARQSFVILELPGDKVVERRISVPAQAQEFLSGIVRNRIDRLSPWPAERAVYGFEVAPSQEHAQALEVHVLIASRAAVDSARDELTAFGLRVDRIVARERGTQAAKAVALWSRFAGASGESFKQARRQIGAVIAAAPGVSLALILWASLSAAGIRQEDEELAARASTLQRQIGATDSGQSLSALAPPERAWVLKATALSTPVVLEALSRSLPDSAYLTEVDLQNMTLRIIGLASDAPSLIAPLERSGHLADVHFFAPTTRAQNGMLFRFNIEARVEPHAKITEP
jgi:general secretion pathway protein L